MAYTFEEFVGELSSLLGMNFKSYKQQRMERRTLSFLRRRGHNDLKELMEGLKKDNNLRENFINHVTINTSEFFRNPNSFTFLQKNVLPQLIKEKTPLKIWSAACSDGCEPYTLALILHDLNVYPRQYSIMATDIDTDIINRARKGQYPFKALRNVPKHLLKEHFQEKNDLYHLDSRVKSTIDFKQHNLLKDTFTNAFDLILCRNFFIYLERVHKEEIIRKFVKSLRKRGILFLGNTEFIVNPQEFSLTKIGAAFYRKD